VRTWRPHPAPRAAATTIGGPLATLPLPWRVPARGVAELLLSGAPAPSALPDRVGALVGAGPGLTPSGDDVLCGVLLGLRLHPRGTSAFVDELWRAVRPRLTATTSLSASLLREAADGYAAEPVTRLLQRLASAGSDSSSAVREGTTVTEAVHEVLAIGHTSGADLLGGLAGCLDALTAQSGQTAPSASTTVNPPTATSLSATPRSLP